MIYRDAHLSPIYIMSQNHRPIALPLFTSYSLAITKAIYTYVNTYDYRHIIRT